MEDKNTESELYNYTKAENSNFPHSLLKEYGEQSLLAIFQSRDLSENFKGTVR